MFAYARFVSSTCRVSFTDGANVTHTITVSASSLYEAAALAIAEFKRNGFALAAIGPGTNLKISVQPPVVEYDLSVSKLHAWLNSTGKTPREQATKVTLRQILAK
jgi:hypothetical protein